MDIRALICCRPSPQEFIEEAGVHIPLTRFRVFVSAERGAGEEQAHERSFRVEAQVFGLLSGVVGLERVLTAGACDQFDPVDAMR